MSGSSVRVEVLGPLRVLAADRTDLTPTGTLQRRLLSLLVLRRGHVVSVDQAVDALWPRDAPADPAAALQNHVSRLRRTLPAGTITSVGDGYRLDPTTIELDVDRIERIVVEGTARAEEHLTELDALLDRWRGPAYPELDDTDDGRAEAVRLDELRCRARELRAATRIARGEHDAALADLAALANEHPLRERPRELQMEALAAAGRTAEALRVYDDFRRTVGDELGIQPSAALTARHDALLSGTARPWKPSSRVPAPTTSLLGRDELADEITAAARTHRLVTLVGFGGVGKTRLLIEVGRRLLADEARRTVVFCELAGAEHDTVADVVAGALGVDPRRDVDTVTQLADVLRPNDLTLLLDNCEHVLDASAQLARRLLAECPSLTIVATSRERLRIAGERVQTVPTLPSDDDDSPGSRLFVERARAVLPTFEPSPTDRARIAEIVRRLDGLPLAIELAAARLHTHTLDELEVGLDRRFALLSAGYRASDRHGSLSAVVAWSVDQLPFGLRWLFANLSVFVGPFAARDAAGVSNLEPGQAAEMLNSLVERSLVIRTRDGRYVLLETLRSFGAELLAADDRADEVAANHAAHFTQWAVDANRRMIDPAEHAIAEIDATLPELRSALGWLVDHGEVEAAGRLVTALFDYAFLRLRPDVMAWAERVTAADPTDRSPVAAQVWVVAAYAAWMAGDVTEHGARIARAGAAVGPHGHVPQELMSGRGALELFEGRLAESARWFTAAAAASISEGRRLFAAASALLALGYAGDPSVEERSHALLADVADTPTPYAAYVWYCAGEADLRVDPDRARARFQRALAIADRTGASIVTGVAGASKASLDARVGDPHTAATDYKALVLHWQRAGMWSTQWTMLRSIAGLLDRLGRHRDAAVLEGAVRSTAAGHRIFGADAKALDEMSARLRSALGDDIYDAARREGAVLDGAAAIEHALRALG